MINCENGVAYRTLDFLGYPNYRVGDDGSVWKFLKKKKYWKSLKGSGFTKSKSNRYYLHTKLSKNNIQVVYATHRLILLAFEGPSTKPLVRHLNDDWTDNRLINLQYGTTTDNQNDAILNKKWKPELLRRGVRHHMTTLSEIEVRQIKRDIKIMKNCDIAQKFNVSPKVINDIKVGRTWRHI